MKRKIIVGKSIGFCFGVTKAVETAKKILKQHGCLVSLGDIVHNDPVMQELKKEGLRVIRNISEIKGLPFIIRSHGLPPDLLAKIKKKTDYVYDATCPFVRKVQNLIKKLVEEKNFIFLIGDPEHPEIIAMKKIAGKNCLIIKPDGDTKLPQIKLSKWAVIAQTTLSLELYKSAIGKILNVIPKERITIFNTICPVSIKRQNEAKQIAGKVDLLIVVGGRKSSNTAKLVSIGKKINKNTILIEEPSEVQNLNFAKIKKIGIISGASTDVKCIKKVIEFLKDHSAQKKQGGKTR